MNSLPVIIGRMSPLRSLIRCQMRSSSVGFIALDLSVSLLFLLDICVNPRTHGQPLPRKSGSFQRCAANGARVSASALPAAGLAVCLVEEGSSPGAVRLTRYPEIVVVGMSAMAAQTICVRSGVGGRPPRPARAADALRGGRSDPGGRRSDASRVALERAGAAPHLAYAHGTRCDGQEWPFISK
jgi:hypothetical protein